MGTKSTKTAAGWTADPADLLRAGPDLDVATMDRSATPGWDAGKSAAQAFMASRGEDLSDLQERLFANGKRGGEESVLLLLQGIDTAGKGGIVRHVIGMVDPQGVALASFGVPTEEERSHHHLWRIRKQLPRPGKIGVFDRSHYEQVLVVKVDGLEPPDVNESRYAELADFDREVVASGTRVVKVALMISHDEQGERLAERIERPDKHWKYSVNDIPVREKWDDYQAAFGEMFARTSVDEAPWYVVPANRKWYARLAVTELLHQALLGLDRPWPEADFDPEVELARLEATARH